MIMFNKGSEGNHLNYPLEKEDLENITKCRLHSPVVGDPNGLTFPSNFNQFAEAAEILEVRLMVEKGIFPYEFMQKYYPFEGEFPMEIPEPLKMEGLCYEAPQGLADVVHMDMPVDAPHSCLRWILRNGGNVKKWTPNHVNFLESIPDVIENIADAVKRSLHKGFEAKYHFGIGRPEEVWADNGVKDNTTAYPEGCPNHPSYPAGHGCAVAAGIDSIIKQFNTTAQQRKVLLDTAYVWAMARSLAGVHYGIDNVAGLVIGGLGKYMVRTELDKYTK